MKKCISFVIIGLAFLLNSNISFAELSQTQQAKYKTQIEKAYNGFEKQISSLSQKKQVEKLNTLVSKILILEAKKLSENNRFILSYLKTLIQNKISSLNNVKISSTTTTTNVINASKSELLNELYKPNFNYKNGVAWNNDGKYDCRFYDDYLLKGTCEPYPSDYLQGKMKDLEEMRIKQEEVINNAIKPALYNKFAYDSNGSISASSDLNVTGSKKEKALKYEEAIKNLLKKGPISLTESYGLENIYKLAQGVNYESLAYHRYYASENGKASITNVNVTWFADGDISAIGAISIKETYSNGNVIQIGVSGMGGQTLAVRVFEGKINGESFGESFADGNERIKTQGAFLNNERILRGFMYIPQY